VEWFAQNKPLFIVVINQVLTCWCHQVDALCAPCLCFMVLVVALFWCVLFVLCVYLVRWCKCAVI